MNLKQSSYEVLPDGDMNIRQQIFPFLITSSVSANSLVYFTLKDKKIVNQFLSDWNRLLQEW